MLENERWIVYERQKVRRSLQWKKRNTCAHLEKYVLSRSYHYVGFKDSLALTGISSLPFSMSFS